MSEHLDEARGDGSNHGQKSSPAGPKIEIMFYEAGGIEGSVYWID